MNIPAHIFAILERLVAILAFALKDADFIGNQKNGYHVLIVVSQLLLLVADAQVQCCHWDGTCPWTGRDGTRPGHVQEV